MTRSIRLFITAALLLSCFLPLSAMARAETPAAMTQEEAKAQFLREFLWTQNFGVLGVDQYGQAVSSATYMQIYQGIIPRHVSTEELFVLTGRDDLTKEYRRRLRRKNTFLWGGLGVMTAGAVLAMAPIYLALKEEPDSFKAWPLVTGIGAVLAGSTMMIVAAAMNPHFLEGSEIQELINDYNYRLMRDLDLDEEVLPQEPQKGGIEGLQVNFFHQKEGSGLALSFRF